MNRGSSPALDVRKLLLKLEAPALRNLPFYLFQFGGTTLFIISYCFPRTEDSSEKNFGKNIFASSLPVADFLTAPTACTADLVTRASSFQFETHFQFPNPTLLE